MRPIQTTCKRGHDISLSEQRSNYDGRCLLCKRAKDKRWINNGNKQSPEYQANWKTANPEKSIIYSRKYFLYKKYGLTINEYQKLWEAQNGLCYVCGKSETAKDRTGKIRAYLSVDHDHITGKVRSLLCHHCNAALGHVRDNPALLYKLISYLEGTL